VSQRVPQNASEVWRLLKRRYGDFDHYNRANPFDELLFILCSSKTTEGGYRRTFSSLRRAFPTNELLANASAKEIEIAIRQGGLFAKKARAIYKISGTLICTFGRLTLSPLRSLDNDACEAFLTSLPGVGRKTARCVMLYSLGRDVFPVDVHCWRIALRLGWIRRTSKRRVPSPRDEERLQARIPTRLRYSLHVNLLSLGRDICTSRYPKCTSCPLTSLCPKIGLTDKVVREFRSGESSRRFLD
jgi:endonuclease III